MDARRGPPRKELVPAALDGLSRIDEVRIMGRRRCRIAASRWHSSSTCHAPTWVRCWTTTASRCGLDTTARGRCTAVRPLRRATARARSPSTHPRRGRPPGAGVRRASSFSIRGGQDRSDQGIGIGIDRALEQIYQEVILDHYSIHTHRGLREPFGAQVHHVNPTCGDEVTLSGSP